MNVLLVQPRYYTTFPPLGLLKLASYHRHKNRKIHFQDLNRPEDWQSAPFEPERIEVTSLWTWEHDSVNRTIRRLEMKYPKAHIRLGGLYASLMPEHARAATKSEVVVGVIPELDVVTPAYDLVPYWKKTMYFATRGCNNTCAFCIVPRLEGKVHRIINNLYLHEGHNELVLFDNNLLAAKDSIDILKQVIELGVKVDFHNGLDFKEMTPEKAELLSRIKIPYYKTALDYSSERKAFFEGVDMMLDVGIKGKRILPYLLYNFTDTPEDFLQRLNWCIEKGIAAFPMRYQPLKGPHALVKNSFIGKHWTNNKLRFVTVARSMVGNNGCIYPSAGTTEFFNDGRFLGDVLIK